MTFHDTAIAGQAPPASESAVSGGFDPSDFRPTLKTRLLVLQPTPFCNIDCDYCYLPQRNLKTRMSLDTVWQAAQRLRDDKLVGETLAVVWHAGEPLAMPRSFYEEAVALIGEVLGAGCRVSHSIQTNATLINDEWCDLFKRHHFRIGVSVDGPAELHDLHRRRRNGKGSHALVMRGIERLRAHGIVFHTISVVTERTLKQPDSFFDFFLQLGIGEMGCNFDEAEGIHAESSLRGKDQAHEWFLERLLDRSVQYHGGGHRVLVRELAYAYSLIEHGMPTYRWRGRQLPYNAQVLPFAIVTVAWNGDFCTFSPELSGQSSAEYGNFRLGNVAKEGFLQSTGSKPFLRMWDAILGGNAACERSCAHFLYCGGGAPANKLYENGSLRSAETLYCRAMIKRPLDLLLRRIEQQPGTVVRLFSDSRIRESRAKP